MPEKLLEVRALKVAFRIHARTIEAVRGVDLAIDSGEIVGLVGESGSGKSVTMKSIIRMLPESARMTAARCAVTGPS
jgi:ABC-type dipeptide/oligopeptide/nickel transport system ATPase component